MKLIQKIREILANNKFDLADKLIEIESLLPKEQSKEKEYAEIFGQKCEVKRDFNSLIFDGSTGCEYVDNPKLNNPDDIYYDGCGCTWGTDLDGKRFWKRYNAFNDRSRNSNLSHGDIVNEKARIKKLIMECLSEMGW